MMGLQGELRRRRAGEPGGAEDLELLPAQVPGESGQIAVAHDQRGQIVRFGRTHERFTSALRCRLSQLTRGLV